MSTQDYYPEQGEFNPAEAMRDMDGAERTSFDRLRTAWEAVDFGVELIDKLRFDDEPEQSPVSNEVAGRVANFAREASIQADARQAETVAGHKRIVDEYAVDGTTMLNEAGEDHKPLVKNDASQATPSMPSTYLHPDVQNALESYGPGTPDTYIHPAFNDLQGTDANSDYLQGVN